MATITHKLMLSATEANLVGEVKVRQADDETQVFEVTVLENGTIKNFAGLKPFFCLMAREITGQGVSEEPVTEYDGSKGTLKYTVSANAMQMVGRNEAYFSFREELSNGEWIEQFSTRSFYYTVERSIYTQPFKDSNYWWTFKELYRQFLEYQVSGKKSWEEFVEQNKEIIENIDPGGKVLTELIAARNGKPNLKTRIDDLENETNAQLAQTASKTQWVNPIAFGAKGDGVTDDTVALQNACDYAYQHNLAFIVPSREYNFLISQPIYLDRYTSYDFNWSTITKTTNNVGSGATSTKGNITSKSTKVDAFFIGREPANFALTFMELKRVNFKRTAPNRVKYGLYVDLVQQCKISDLFSYQDTEGKKGATDYLCYGSMWCMMDEFRNISQYWGIKTLVLTGATIPGSTSLNIENIVGADQEGCLDLTGSPYCTITNPMIDRCNGVAFQFSSCPEVTITSPSVEILRGTGRYLVLSASGVVITTPRLIYLQGASSERALITVDNNSRLTVLGGNFPAYENQVSSAFDLNFIITNSVVHLVHTILPTNGNDYIGLAQGASITYVNRDGTTYRDADGRGSKANGLRTLYRPAPPTAGTYKKGEKILNTYTTNQEVEYWVCVEAGSPGIWEARKAHKLEVTRSAVWTGDGVTKTFSATHGLGYIPTYFTVTPENSTSGVAEISHVTVTATQINVSFKTAIPSAEVAIVKWLVR